MIYDSINAFDSNHNFNPALNKVLDYLRQTDFSKFPLGVRTNLNGNSQSPQGAGYKK
jgi:beta-galactosidase beta subunit